MIKYIGIVLFSFSLIFNLLSLKAFIKLTDDMQDKIDNYPELAHLNGFEMYFFTLWTFIFQMLFMIVAILDEISNILEFSLYTRKLLSKSRAVMYNTILFPASLLVITLFWSIWHIERELIFPTVLDSFFPMWLNHMLHTFIILPVIIELLLPKKYYFVKFDRAAPVLIVIFLIYLSLYFSVYFRHGIWLYPVYKVMTWAQRGIFSLLQLGMALGFQKLGIKLQNAKRPQNRLKIN